MDVGQMQYQHWTDCDEHYVDAMCQSDYQDFVNALGKGKGLAKGKGKQSGKSLGKGSSSVQCYSCGDFGHIAANCLSKPKGKGKSGPTCWHCGVFGHLLGVPSLPSGPLIIWASEGCER